MHKIFIRISLFLSIICLAPACNNVIDRPSLDRNEYLAKFLPELSTGTTYDLEFCYHASVGGYQSVAQIRANSDVVKAILVAKRAVIVPSDRIGTQTNYELLLRRTSSLCKGFSEKVQSNEKRMYSLFDGIQSNEPVEIYVSDDFKVVYLIFIGK